MFSPLSPFSRHVDKLWSPASPAFPQRRPGRRADSLAAAKPRGWERTCHDFGGWNGGDGGFGRPGW
jgi:hypothetical protein